MRDGSEKDVGGEAAAAGSATRRGHQQSGGRTHRAIAQCHGPPRPQPGSHSGGNGSRDRGRQGRNANTQLRRMAATDCRRLRHAFLHRRPCRAAHAQRARGGRPRRLVGHSMGAAHRPGCHACVRGEGDCTTGQNEAGRPQDAKARRTHAHPVERRPWQATPAVRGTHAAAEPAAAAGPPRVAKGRCRRQNQFAQASGGGQLAMAPTGRCGRYVEHLTSLSAAGRKTKTTPTINGATRAVPRVLSFHCSILGPRRGRADAPKCLGRARAAGALRKGRRRSWRTNP